MSTATLRQVVTSPDLPEWAPWVRMTAGFDSAAQKTWSLRRPVTLLGSRRPAHIVLHDRTTSESHCVIVNTGYHVLLKDLCSESGTSRNGSRIAGVAVLRNGDVIKIGETELHITIEEDPNAPPQRKDVSRAQDSGKMAEPIAVCLQESGTIWRLGDAVAVIGSHPHACVRLDHDAVSERHAVLFTFLERPAIFDTGSRTGVWVNGERCTTAHVCPEDRVLVGPFGLSIDAKDAQTEDHMNASSDAAAPDIHSPFSMLKKGKHENGIKSGKAIGATALRVPRERRAADRDQWERLHIVPHRSSAKPQEPCETVADPESRTRAAADATNDGDPGDSSTMALAREQLGHREAELTQRESELQRREQLLTKHWTSLLSKGCPRCGQPLITPDAIAEDTAAQDHADT